MTALDNGVRCERHIGEAFPPRCYDCGTSPIAYAPLTASGMCSRHAGYPAPCARCEREQEDGQGDR